MALQGIQVVELAGLAPVPFCGMILADFGATVLRIDRCGGTFMDGLGNGKQSLALNLKSQKGAKILRQLCNKSDVLIEPFRAGVMESLHLGPDVLLKENQKLIYARLTGFGQSGLYCKRAGHDINYVGLSGLLSLFGRYGEKPTFPVNVVADFAGGGLTCALGITLALLEREKSGLGQVIDCNMVEGSAYLGSWLYRSQNLPLWGQNRGKNVLDTGAHFYDVYETKDGKFMSVGALESQFYDKLLDGLGLTHNEAPHFGDFESGKKLFTSKFLEKTQEEWCHIFDNIDACVAPVLSLSEAPLHKHNLEQKSFVKSSNSGTMVPNVAPRLTRTPGKSQSTKPAPTTGQHTTSILKDLNYTDEQIFELEKENIIQIGINSKI